MPKTYHIPQPPKDIYYYSTGSRESTMYQEHAKSMLIEKITFDQGIQVFVKGAMFPKKGFPTPEAVWSANQAKRLLIESLKLPFLFLHSLKKLLSVYNSIALQAVRPFILNDEYMTPVGQEIKSYAYVFLLHLGLEKRTLTQQKISSDFADIIGFMIDIDDAYRYRIQDIASETTAEELIAKPIREIRRLTKIIIARDSPGVASKFQRVSTILQLALLIPRFRKAFKKTLSENFLFFRKLQYTQADEYWVWNRLDYKYMGMTQELRMELAKKKEWVFPQLYDYDIINQNNVS